MARVAVCADVALLAAAGALSYSILIILSTLDWFAGGGGGSFLPGTFECFNAIISFPVATHHYTHTHIGLKGIDLMRVFLGQQQR